MLLQKLSDILSLHRLTVLRVIHMIFDNAVFTYKFPMFYAELRGHLISMCITKNLRYLESFLNQLFCMFIRGKLDRFLIVLRGTVVRVTERTIKLSLDDKFLTLTLHHSSLYTLSAGCFIATF